MADKTAKADAGSRRLLIHSMAALVDQAWLSLLNMAVGLMLIRLTTPDQYGVYSQVFAAGLLAVTICESLVVNPMITLGARGSAQGRGPLIANLAVFHRRVAVAASVALGVVGALWLDFGHASMVAFAVGLGVYCFATARREYQRSISFLEGKPEVVLATDLAFGVALMVGVGLLAWADLLDMPVLMLVMAAACIVPWVTGPQVPRKKESSESYLEHRSEAVARGRLGLPGALTSWTVNFSYLYVAAAFLGAAAAAELNASRLLLVPISLSVVAWGRVARPMIGRLLDQRDTHGLTRLLGRSAAALVGLALVYAAIVLVCLGWLEVHVLGDDYTGLGTLVVAWAIYFAAYSLRWIGTVLLLALDAYKDSLHAAMVSLAVLVVLLPVALHFYGVDGAVMALVGVEIITLLLVWLRFVPRRLAAAA